MRTGTRAFADEVANILTYLVNEAATVLEPAPGRIIPVAPGDDVSHDDCCEGQLWGRLVSLGPSENARVGSGNGLGDCYTPHFLATLELGIARCAHVLNDRGQAPTASQISSDGEQGLDDMAALLEVLKCSGIVRSLGQWTPSGPQGACHSGTWKFTVRLGNCLDCGEPGVEG